MVRFALTRSEEVIIPHTKVSGGRALLNLPGNHSTAAIVAEVREPERGDWVNAAVTISDCTRTINLDFDVNDARDFENNLYKIDTMIDTLRKFRRAVVRVQSRKTA